MRKCPCIRDRADALDHQILATALAAVLGSILTTLIPSSESAGVWIFLGWMVAVWLLSIIVGELLAVFIVGIEFAILVSVDLVFSAEMLVYGESAWYWRSGLTYGLILIIIAVLTVIHVLYNVVMERACAYQQKRLDPPPSTTQYKKITPKFEIENWPL